MSLQMQRIPLNESRCVGVRASRRPLVAQCKHTGSSRQAVSSAPAEVVEHQVQMCRRTVLAGGLLLASSLCTPRMVLAEESATGSGTKVRRCGADFTHLPTTACHELPAHLLPDPTTSSHTEQTVVTHTSCHSRQRSRPSAYVPCTPPPAPPAHPSCTCTPSRLLQSYFPFFPPSVFPWPKAPAHFLRCLAAGVFRREHPGRACRPHRGGAVWGRARRCSALHAAGLGAGWCGLPPVQVQRRAAGGRRAGLDTWLWPSGCTWACVVRAVR